MAAEAEPRTQGVNKQDSRNVGIARKYGGEQTEASVRNARPVRDRLRRVIPLDFWDFEQAWEQAIFEKNEYVYVLESDFDDHASGYHCWFRVRKERYLTEWQSALEACRRIIHQMDGK